MRALTATCWYVLAPLSAGTALAQSVTPTDAQFADFAFASELGSGVYSIDGRTITVYTVPFGYTLRAAAPRGGRPGIRLLLPTTFGFFNFQTSDLAHFDLPSSIGALSFEPGVELDYWLNDAWHLVERRQRGGPQQRNRDAVPVEHTGGTLLLSPGEITQVALFVCPDLAFEVGIL